MCVCVSYDEHFLLTEGKHLALWSESLLHNSAPTLMAGVGQGSSEKADLSCPLIENNSNILFLILFLLKQIVVKSRH